MATWSTKSSSRKSWEPLLDSQQRQIDGINQIMGAVTVIVVLMTAALIVMVVGLFLDGFRDKANSYQALQMKTETVERNQEFIVATQTKEIEALKQKIMDLSWTISQQSKILQNKP
jgi:cell division protein FtsL